MVDKPYPIDGLTLREDFFSSEEAAALVAYIDAEKWDATLRRRVQHYGYYYDYQARTVLGTKQRAPWPEWLDPIAERLVAEGYFQEKPNQAIVNEYAPGQGIAPHIDCLPCFGDTIASISLLSLAVMDFIRPAHIAMREHGPYRVSVPLKPGSIILLTGAARYDWSHSIPPRKTDEIDGVKMPRGRRLSLTFRNVVS